MTGLIRSEKHLYSWDSGPWDPGVTSCIKMLDKSGPLVGWAKRETAACAVRNLPLLEQMVRDGGPVAATKWLSAIPDFQRDTSADLGTRVHALAEALHRKQPIEVDELTAPFVESYMTWWDRMKPKALNAEFMVYSLTHRYGGTADLAADINGELWLLDLKSGKGVYSETGLQLAALNFADWCGRPNDPKKYKVPPAKRFGVIHVRPDGCELVPFDVTQAEMNAFLACRQLYEWTNERAPFMNMQKKAA